MRNMKLLFVHDGPLYKDKEGNYYEYSYHGLYERYSYIADDITFLMRVAPLTENTKGTLLSRDLHVIEVPNFKTIKNYWKNKCSAKKIIRNAVLNSDCLVLRNSSCASIAIEFAKKLNKPYIFECVGCCWDSLWNHSLLGKIIAPYEYLRTRFFISKAPFVYYVTNEFLQKRYPTSGLSIGCSNVVLEDLDETILQKRLKRIHSMTGKRELVVGTAAALDVRYKGQEYVIKAISDLKKSKISLHYKLAGGNRKNSTFLYDLAKKNRVLENVEFCGSLSAKEMNDFYDSIDIYIQPSKQEGLPRSVIEAMGRGCPVIGSDIAGIPELIQKENLFRSGDYKDLAKHIKKLLLSDLEQTSKENFRKSMDYQKKNLDAKRKDFYDLFLDSILAK